MGCATTTRRLVSDLGNETGQTAAAQRSSITAHQALAAWLLFSVQPTEEHLRSAQAATQRAYGLPAGWPVGEPLEPSQGTQAIVVAQSAGAAALTPAAAPGLAPAGEVVATPKGADDEAPAGSGVDDPEGSGVAAPAAMDH